MVSKKLTDKEAEQQEKDFLDNIRKEVVDGWENMTGPELLARLHINVCYLAAFGGVPLIVLQACAANNYSARAAELGIYVPESEDN